MLVSCNSCGWIHHIILRSDAEECVASSGGISIENFEKCFHCSNSYKNFHEVDATAVAVGATIQPIILGFSNGQKF